MYIVLWICRIFVGIRFNGVWLSLVERYVRDVEAAGSNPVTPTIAKSGKPAFSEMKGLVF